MSVPSVEPVEAVSDEVVSESVPVPDSPVLEEIGSESLSVVPGLGVDADVLRDRSLRRTRDGGIIAAMATPPRQRRPQDFKPGRITGWPAGWSEERVQELALGACYKADGKHKDYPSPGGEWDYVFRAEGTKCPKLSSSVWPRLQDGLRDALIAGVVQWDDRCVTYPARAWIRLDGRLCEARLTNDVRGEYHGFPLDYEEHHPRDPAGLLERAPTVYT